MSAPETDQPKPVSGFRISRTTLYLAIGQTVFWASTFYLLPALMLDLEQSMGWSKSQISGAMTGSILASAICARPCGRIIDRGYGMQMMGVGGTLAGLLLLACSQAVSIWHFYACWLVIGVCMAAILYEPCFSIVTRHHNTEARRIITHITLIAGLAGTIAFPAATWISVQWDWRTAFLVFGLAVLFIAMPMTYFAIRTLETSFPAAVHQSTQSGSLKRTRQLMFWLIAGAFTLGSINHTMVMSHLLALLNERGISSQSAVIAAMLIGPMQVVGRFILMANERRITTRATGFICLCGLTLSTALLWWAGVSIAWVYFAACLHGAAWGLVSITRPTLIREVLGAEDFGATSGTVATVAIFGIALAPSIGAALWKMGGYDLMLGTGLCLTMTGALFLWLLGKQHIAVSAKH